MTPDELRSLADAIVYRDSLAIARAADYLRALADALSSGTHYVESPELHEAMIRAADYLRAQADAQPVAWRCEVRGDGTDPKLGAVDWRHYHTTTSKREAQAFVARCGNGIEGRAVPLYPHAAAPQPEPKRPAFLDEIDRAKEHVASWPQWMKDATVSAAATLPVTEPKREALRGLAPTHRCPACGAFWRQCDDASWNLRSASCCGLCDAGRVELVCWLDEPKREPLSDWRIGELYRQWLAESGTTTITDLMRSVERAHEIGGSDAGTD